MNQATKGSNSSRRTPNSRHAKVRRPSYGPTRGKRQLTTNGRME